MTYSKPKPPKTEEQVAEEAEINGYFENFRSESLPVLAKCLRDAADRIEALVEHLPRHSATCDTDGCGVGNLADEADGMIGAAFDLKGTAEQWALWIHNQREAEIQYLRDLASQN